ncbi:MAG: DNA methyltransferase [Phycisphaerales bacterium]
MQLERIPADKINPAPYNPRRDLKPGDREYESLRRSIGEFGLVEPLVWNRRSGHLVGGHQRFKVLLQRGELEVDVSVVDLPPEKEKALNIALNKIQGGWDEGKLAALLDEIIDSPDLDLGLTGFELDEAHDVITAALDASDLQPETDFDIANALDAAGPPVTNPGELIELGTDPASSHRLFCGDCTDPEVVRSLMRGERARLFATDPPYLVGYDGTNHPGAKRLRGNPGRNSLDGGRKDWSGTYGVNWDDADANTDLYDRFVRVAVDEAIAVDAAWYCWHASKRQPMLESAWSAAGALAHCQIIWAKNKGVPTRTWYLWQHEPCLMGWLQGHKPPQVSRKKLSTVWNVDTIPNGADRPDHPTPKPLELFEIPMRQHTRRGEVCYEPFAGSGTQFIAAQRLGRRCFGIEISPVYCDLIVRRFIAFVGEKSVAPEIAERYRLPETVEAA